MMEMLEKVLFLATKYPDLVAAVLGISFSLAATQFFKKFIPDSWSDENYGKAAQLIGFVTGTLFAHGAWRLLDPSSNHFEKFYASVGCGFASPAIYSFAMGYLENKFKWFDKYFGGRQKDGSPSSSDSNKG
jgi:Na+(H+)/acetate symporter ActP